MARKPRLLRLLGIGLIATALLLGFYTLVAYLAWQSGQDLRNEQIQKTRQAELANQLEHARQEIETGNYRLALRRLTWILEQDPGHRDATALKAQAEDALGQSGLSERTSTPDAASVTATPPVTVTTNDEENTDAASALSQIEELVEAEEWEGAITALVTFQNAYPSYERRHSDKLLHEVYIGRGVELLYGEQVELGLFYFSQAEKLGNLPQDVLNQRQWAELYLAGMGYYAVSWDVALFYFRDLCMAAPFFHNSCQKLYDALVAYGDQLAVQQNWCPAEALYAEAYQIDDNRALGQKLDEARTACAAATPTASPPITGTVPVESETRIEER